MPRSHLCTTFLSEILAPQILIALLVLQSLKKQMLFVFYLAFHVLHDRIGLIKASLP